MPRKSSASLALVRPDPIESLPRPSADAPGEIVRLFADIIAKVPRGHFKPADGILLEQYCQATVLAQTAYAELAKTGPVTADGKVSPWVGILEKQHRSAAVLAGKLRLAPAARMSSRSVGRASGSRPSIYELMPDD
jgi:hypothetical protein